MLAGSLSRTWLCLIYNWWCCTSLPRVGLKAIARYTLYGFYGNRFFFVGTQNSTRIDPDKLRHDKHFQTVAMVCDSRTKNLPLRKQKKLGC